MSWRSIRGWFDFEDIYDLAVVEAPPNATLVEVGVAYGKSLAYLARKVIDAGRDDIAVVGVDPWPEVWGDWDDRPMLVARYGNDPYKAFLGEMTAHAPTELDRVVIHRCTSVEGAARAAANPGGPISFVFIDAVHDKPHVLEDIDAWRPLIVPGGILAGHDHTGSWPGVEAAVTERFGKPGVGYEVRGSSWLKRL